MMDCSITKKDAVFNIIHESVVLRPNTLVGFCTVIMENVYIGLNCDIGHHVVIYPDTVIGNNVRIDDHAVVGKLPMKAATSIFTEEAELKHAKIDDGCLIGTSAILYRGCTVGKHVLIADQASVREQVFIGDYTIIGRGVAIENLVEVGSRCKIQAGAYIAPLSTIGNDCFISPEVTVTNDNFMGRTEERKKCFKGITIQDGGRVGANATLLPGRTIAADGVAAAGAVVTQDIPARKIVAGVPSRLFRDVPQEQWLGNQQTNSRSVVDRTNAMQKMPLLDSIPADS